MPAVWGPQDEVGNLNELTDATRLAALKLVTQGKVYDLGLPYDRYSYKWPGHGPGEIISFRSPLGVRSQKDLPFTTPEGGCEKQGRIVCSVKRSPGPDVTDHSFE